ncbi:hypothetical protein GCM10010246_59180 [Streptomyces cuspidosporus]|uniref:NADP-dependent oxidoreductase domain-containing protein n=1 Tax=Streptomyces cuspidosporus TaxID=66882 RepID=A0ABN3GTX4_9ACTN
MRTLRIGPEGASTGVVGLGRTGMSYAYDPGDRDDDASIAVVHRALDIGADLVDTADAYGPHTNAEPVGRALAGRRERAFLAPKVGCAPGDKPCAATAGAPRRCSAPCRDRNRG